MPNRSASALAENARIRLVMLVLGCSLFLPAREAKPQDQTLKGFSVIENVVSAGGDPVYQVDGYRVQIVARTDRTFRDKINTLADVRTGTWLRFAGKRNASGMVVATKATFYPEKSEVKKPDPVQLEVLAPDHDRLIDSEGNLKPLHSKVRLSDAGGWCGWHRILAEGAQEARVRRIGMSLVPAYQMQMANDQAAKIHFRFFVVEEKEIRSELACNPGLVLVPEALLERLKTDDQLAAVIADGIAYNLQYLRASMIARDGWLTAAEAADFATWAVNPIAGLAAGGAIGLAGHEHNVEMELERGRLALSMMSDAGYDPWQAPEAWKLLGPKHLPRGLGSLKYPRIAQYQLTVLDAQYKKSAAGSAQNPEAATVRND